MAISGKFVALETTVLMAQRNKNCSVATNVCMAGRGKLRMA